MKRIISYCLYGNVPMYLFGAVENVIFAKEIFPDWICRFYCHSSVPADYIKKLSDLGAEVVVIYNDKNAEANTFWVKFWRFYPCSEADIDCVIMRDTDSRPSYKDKVAVDRWIESGKKFNIMHDNEAHGSIILAGMWGCRTNAVPHIKLLIDNYLKKELSGDAKKCLWNSDQLFLTNYVWPIISSSGSYIAYGSNKHMKNRFPELITQEYPEPTTVGYPSNFKTEVETFIGQKIYKPLITESRYNPVISTKVPKKTNDIIYVYHNESSSTIKKSWVCIRFIRMIETMEGLPINRSVKMTDNIEEADVIVGAYEASLIKFIDSNKNRYNFTNKKFLSWCLEPKWSTTDKQVIKHNEFDIHIMNCYTKDVYVSPLHFCSTLAFKHFDPSKMNKERYIESKNRIVVVATAKTDDHIKNIVIPGKNLVTLRYNIAMGAYNKDQDSIVIHGKGWPDGVAKQYSGSEKEVYRQKIDILKDHYFNLCMENTSYDNYISEKIWHSIIAGCLPIYYGNPSIYTIFPENSFIDTTKFKNIPSLLGFIKNMTFEQFTLRFNKCYDAIKKITQDDLHKAHILTKQKIGEKIISIMDN